MPSSKHITLIFLLLLHLSLNFYTLFIPSTTQPLQNSYRWQFITSHHSHFSSTPTYKLLLSPTLLYSSLLHLPYKSFTPHLQLANLVWYNPLQHTTYTHPNNPLNTPTLHNSTPPNYTHNKPLTPS